MSFTNKIKEFFRLEGKDKEVVPPSKRTDAKKERILSILYIGVAILFITILLYPSRPVFYADLSVGEVAPRNIKAPYDFYYEDRISTEEKKYQVEFQSPPVYDYDVNQRDRLIDRSDFLFKEVDKIKADNKLSLEEKEKKVSELYQGKFASKGVQALLSLPSLQPLRNGVKGLLSMTMSKVVYEDADLLYYKDRGGILVLKLGQKGKKPEREFKNFVALEQAKSYINSSAKMIFPQRPEQGALAAEIANVLIEPNLTFNKRASEEQKEIIRKQVEPVKVLIQKGEMIVREGERVQEEHLQKLRALKITSSQSNLWVTAGMLLLVSLVFLGFYLYIKKFQQELGFNSQQVLLFSSIFLVCTLIYRIFYYLVKVLSSQTTSLSLSSLQYCLPLALGGVLLAILFNIRLAIVGSVITGIFATIIVGGSFYYFIFSLAGAVVGAFSLTKYEQRTALIRSGLLIALANVYVVITINLLQQRLSTESFLYDLGMSFTSGILVIIFASGILPPLEHFFGKTTDIKLIELSNLSHPALKQLIISAPGTYHHSIMVGSMAEAAAEAIGVNPLLSRVSAYFHDIGKVNKPAYFIENQMDSENRHDRLAPSMSSLILMSHLKEGLEMAQRYKLPAPIIDILRQHHGTSLITFFYQKARSQLKPNLEEINEADYRYPGPKPQTKEAAIVMLADAVEAASRTLTDATPARVQGLVQRIINNIFIDGQLDECNLTLKDLHSIAKSFVHILTAVFHHRVDYPGVKLQDFKKKEEDADLDKKGVREGKGKLTPVKKDRAEDIKRLGAS